MNAEVIELFSKCRFKFTNLVIGQTLDVPMVRALDIADFADATLIVRVHAIDIPSGDASITVTVKSTSPSCDEPDVDFVDAVAVAQVVVEDGGAAGDLEVATLSPNFGSHIQVTVTGTRPTLINVDATLSAELVLRTHARPVRLTTVAPADVTKATAAVGSSSAAAREDHKHDISTATASELTDSTNAEGTATSVARSDHTHSHGSRGGASLHSAATTSVAGFISATDKTKLDNLPMVTSAITSTTTASSTPTLYLCSPSSSFTLTLPAASGNDALRLGVKMVDSNGSTREVTVDGSGAETIDGSTTVVLYVDRDYIELVCDGSNWHMAVDDRIPHSAIVLRNTTQSIPHNTSTDIEFNNVVSEVGNIASVPSTGAITIKRTGDYLISTCCRLSGIDDNERMTLRVRINTSDFAFTNLISAGSSNELAPNTTVMLPLNDGDIVRSRVYHNEGAARSTSTSNDREPRLSVVELRPRLP